MSHRALDPRYSLDSCTFKLHNWRPFQVTPRAIEPDLYSPKRTYPKTANSKRPCLADRATSFSLDSLDMSKLSLIDDERPLPVPSPPLQQHKREQVRWIDRKRRRRGSGSVSGRSSDRSGTARRCCSVGASAAYGTCSAGGPGTDSSGELFVNGDANWGAMDVGEGKGLRRDSGGERENSGSGFTLTGNFDALCNESGYGSEPGYRGDAEFGYGDELEEEEDEPRLLFWGERVRDGSNMEVVGENTFSEQKIHHRGRRKKQDWKMVDPLR